MCPYTFSLAEVEPVGLLRQLARQLIRRLTEQIAEKYNRLLGHPPQKATRKEELRLALHLASC